MRSESLVRIKIIDKVNFLFTKTHQNLDFKQHYLAKYLVSQMSSKQLNL